MDHKTDTDSERAAIIARSIVALSPLPPPAHNERVYGGHGNEIVHSFYTAHQMRFYAKQEILRAAEAWQARASLAASAGSEPVAVLAAERDELFQAAIDFIRTLTGMEPPPIEAAPPEVFAPFRAFVDTVQAITDKRHPSPPEGMVGGWKRGLPITEEMHVAAVKVLHRAAGLDGLPQRMLDAMIAAAPPIAAGGGREMG